MRNSRAEIKIDHWPKIPFPSWIIYRTVWFFNHTYSWFRNYPQKGSNSKVKYSGGFCCCLLALGLGVVFFFLRTRIVAGMQKNRVFESGMQAGRSSSRDQLQAIYIPIMLLPNPLDSYCSFLRSSLHRRMGFGLGMEIQMGGHICVTWAKLVISVVHIRNIKAFGNWMGTVWAPRMVSS